MLLARGYHPACDTFQTQLYPLPEFTSLRLYTHTHTHTWLSLSPYFILLSYCFLSLNSTLIIIHFGGKLSSYFCLQCQKLLYQSVPNCTRVTAVRLKCSL